MTGWAIDESSVVADTFFAIELLSMSPLAAPVAGESLSLLATIPKLLDDRRKKSEDPLLILSAKSPIMAAADDDLDRVPLLFPLLLEAAGTMDDD